MRHIIVAAQTLKDRKVLEKNIETMIGKPKFQLFATASELAEMVGRTPDAVDKQLQKLRDEIPDCFNELQDSDRRANEPKYIYRTRMVLDRLRT